MNIHRGTNISHWLSQSKQRGEKRATFFTEADVKRLADWAFDHIRLPVDEEQLWDEQGRREPEAWHLLDAALRWCDRHGLKVIVDLHILRSHHFIHTEEPALFSDPAEAERFAGLWRQLSDHLRNWPVDQVAYELMNEAVAADPEDWNRVAMVAFSAIRRLEPTRTIVLGSNHFNICGTFDVLRIPDDPHQVLTFHFYEPMLLTHYRASWVPSGRYTGPTRYPGVQVTEEEIAALEPDLQQIVRKYNRPFDRAAMVEVLAKPLAVRQRTGLPLYCGEFGVLHTAPPEPRLKWYRDLISVFLEHRIAWANWDYRGGFGLVDGDGRSTGIAEAMLGVR